ncbi:MAG: hypothetical protein GQF41_0072 [Candidatus Rifleibacterium amylolyticum]|nr:MAG: hypothetical protein GQF41_0072 [Candidatus Rifleibacterium amylolyticum]
MPTLPAHGLIVTCRGKPVLQCQRRHATKVEQATKSGRTDSLLAAQL